MATIKIYDRADELRIEIVGKFAGESVEDVATAWTVAQMGATARRFMTDISRLSGYDPAGRKLLREMYRHGVQFAAGTPLSLVFLNEISTPLRRVPAMARESDAERKEDQVRALPEALKTAASQ